MKQPVKPGVIIAVIVVLVVLIAAYGMKTMGGGGGGTDVGVGADGKPMSGEQGKDFMRKMRGQPTSEQGK